MDFVFQNDDLRNIAITGGYGTGKSSILGSYEKESCKRKYVYVSLADFDAPPFDEQLEKPADEKYGKDHSTLEGKVINQLVHSTRSQKARKTRFRIKRRFPWWKKAVMTGFVMAAALIILSSFWFDNFISFTVDAGSFAHFPGLQAWLLRFAELGIWVPFFSRIILFLMASVLVYTLIGLSISNNILAKLSFGDQQINIFPADNDSSFDKYLDELLYIIDCSGANIFVFEDIDRFNSTEIFVKLREINQLVNRRRGCGKRKARRIDPVRFFYMIRDDLFQSADRVKFFDFIIPAVPVVLAANSYERFIEMTKISNLNNDFDDYLLRDICRYIDDMRILKNIFNEFRIYSAQLMNSGYLDVNKLLSIVTFKNMYPSEFADLQSGKGNLFKLFNVEKHNLVNKEMEIIKSEIAEAKAQSSVEQDDMDPEQHEAAAAGLNHYMRRLPTMKLHELPNQTDGKKALERFSDQPLIQFLIRDGYLDENYIDYMSYFLGYANTHRDHYFLRCVTDQKPQRYDYSIDAPKRVLEELHPSRFEQRTALNNDLFDYMLENLKDYSEQSEHLFRQLKRDKNLGFISQYLQVTGQKPVFMQELNSVWPEMWLIAREQKEFAPTQLLDYIRDSLLYSEAKVLEKLNTGEALTQYISKSRDFLNTGNLDENEIDVMTDMLISLDVRFVDIDFKLSNKDLFDWIYKAARYVLNTPMIALMLTEKYGFEDLKDGFASQSFTLITSDKSQPLFKYVNRSMEDYVKWLKETCSGRIVDSEDAAIELLNHDGPSLEDKNVYLKYLETNIRDIGSVKEQELWPIILRENVVDCSEENVMKYYFSYAQEFDQVLVAFLNTYGGSLQFNYSEMEERFDEASRWLADLVGCQDLTDERYRQLLASHPIQDQSFNMERLADSKLSILLEQGKVAMTMDNLEFLREHYPSHVLDYIELGIESYLSEIASEDTLASEELKELIKRGITDQSRIGLIKQSTEPLSIFAHDYSESVRQFILENNFYEGDLNGLITGYESLSPAIQTVVNQICVGRLDLLLEDEIALPFPLLKQLLSSSSDRSVNLRLLRQSLSAFDIQQAAGLLPQVGLDALIRAFKGKSPRFPKDPVIKAILDICRAKSWISSISEPKEGLYVANGFRRDPPGTHL
ncbi:MAG: hypothetical protein GX316_10380 [Firmicutes bacterium]|nr:hypothetical protein [Bacillota bacterium]